MNAMLSYLKSCPWGTAVGLLLAENLLIFVLALLVGNGLTRRFSARRIADAPDALPAGPLQAQHRALEAGLRSWVERQAGQTLGYVEQLYTFGDLHRHGHEQASSRALSIGYLALVRAARPAASLGATWQSWYHYFPWEDWRLGRPPVLGALERHLVEWAESASTVAERRSRAERLGISFGLGDAVWNEERVLERYELLYESGLVLEARRALGRPGAVQAAEPPEGAARVSASATVSAVAPPATTLIDWTAPEPLAEALAPLPYPVDALPPLLRDLESGRSGRS